MTATATYTIQQLPLEERPRERMLRHGPEVMATAELIAIILGSGMKGTPVLQLAQAILARFGTLHCVAEATIAELCEIKGLGPAKAIQLKAAFTLGVRASQHIGMPKYRIETPLQAYHLLRDEIAHAKQEHFVVIMLDVKGIVITVETVSVGTLSNALVHPREVFYPAIRNKAASVILGHNHPSGDLTPSRQDYDITNKLIEVGKVMGIPVRDHIIVVENDYLSMREKGVMF